ncbi:MAG: hydrogenase nickel incorporation protein HypB [Candidatus Bathyarchaeia archaeon]
MTDQIDVITSEEGETFDIELEADLLKANREIASENHRRMKEYEIVAIDVMGSVGSGKTSLIKSLISSLKRRYRIAVIEGDVTTTIDADLIAIEGVPAIQVNTGKECHLDANLIRKALNHMKLNELDLIFIENVGNLICPAEFPLGSDKRLVVISVTEGPYMVVKHPLMFHNADAVAINKADLAAAMEVNPAKLEQDIAMINPRASIVTTSCRNGLGIRDVANALGLDS